jgi:hypothetical protein
MTFTTNPRCTVIFRTSVRSHSSIFSGGHKDRALTTNAITHARCVSHATRIVTAGGVNTDAAFLEAAAFQPYVALGSTAMY